MWVEWPVPFAELAHETSQEDISVLFPPGWWGFCAQGNLSSYILKRAAISSCPWLSTAISVQHAAWTTRKHEVAIVSLPSLLETTYYPNISYPKESKFLKLTEHSLFLRKKFRDSRCYYLFRCSQMPSGTRLSCSTILSFSTLALLSRSYLRTMWWLLQGDVWDMGFVPTSGQEGEEMGKGLFPLSTCFSIHQGKPLIMFHESKWMSHWPMIWLKWPRSVWLI